MERGEEFPVWIPEHSVCRNDGVRTTEAWSEADIDEEEDADNFAFESQGLPFPKVTQGRGEGGVSREGLLKGLVDIS